MKRDTRNHPGGAADLRVVAAALHSLDRIRSGQDPVPTPPIGLEPEVEYVAALIHASRNGVSAENLAVLAAAKFSKNPRFDEKCFFEVCGVEWTEDS